MGGKKLTRAQLDTLPAKFSNCQTAGQLKAALAQVPDELPLSVEGRRGAALRGINIHNVAKARLYLEGCRS